jgi:hypothetical protein
MEDTTPVHANPGYPASRLLQELATAAAHDDPAVRRAAERRASTWRRIAAGMASGLLSIGSRTPVRGLPAWVTPEVAHGGFATGAAAAAGPLRPHELDLIRRHGLKRDRAALYAHHLTEAGLEHLGAVHPADPHERTRPRHRLAPAGGHLGPLAGAAVVETGQDSGSHGQGGLTGALVNYFARFVFFLFEPFFDHHLFHNRFFRFINFFFHIA